MERIEAVPHYQMNRIATESVLRAARRLDPTEDTHTITVDGTPFEAENTPIHSLTRNGEIEVAERIENYALQGRTRYRVVLTWMVEDERGDSILLETKIEVNADFEVVTFRVYSTD